MLVLVLFSNKASSKQCNIFLLLCCSLWSLIFGLRGYNVGNDTPHYAGFFDGTNPAYGGYGTYKAPGETIEWGYIMINRFLSIFSSSATFLFLIHAFFLFSLIYILYKDKKSSIMSLIWLFSFGSMLTVMMVAMRQSFSVCFVLLSYILLAKLQEKNLSKKEMLKDKYFWFAFISFVFSVTVHRTSIFFFPVLLVLYFVRLNKKIIYALIFMALIVAALYKDLLSNFFDMGMFLIGGVEDDKISLLADRYREDMENTGASFFSLIALISPVIVTTYLSKKNDINTLPYKSLIFGLVIFVLFSSSPVVSRIVLVFLILGYSVSVPKAVSKNRLLFLFYFMVSSYYLWRSIAHFYDDLASKNNTYIFYNFFWE